jgi:hypothetical protein
VVGEQLPHAVVQNDGWQWVNEGTAVKPKWGFVSWQVGATLVLKVDTRTAAGQPQQQQPQQQPAAKRKSKDKPQASTTAQEAAKLTAPGPTTAATAAAEAAPGAPSAAGTGAEAEKKGGEDMGSSGDGFKVPNMIVWVGYVKSWRSMGSASFNCIKGCQCQATTVDALHDLGNTQQRMVKLYATPAKECLI